MKQAPDENKKQKDIDRKIKRILLTLSKSLP
jgi:hypothetical protein